MCCFKRCSLARFRGGVTSVSVWFSCIFGVYFSLPHGGLHHPSHISTNYQKTTQYNHPFINTHQLTTHLKNRQGHNNALNRTAPVPSESWPTERGWSRCVWRSSLGNLHALFSSPPERLLWGCGEPRPVREGDERRESDGGNMGKPEQSPGRWTVSRKHCSLSGCQQPSLPVVAVWLVCLLAGGPSS